MWLGQDESMQGVGCPGGVCIGADGALYERVQGIDGFGNSIGFWGRSGAGPSLGEIAQGPDGNLYQWVQGVDGLGNPVGGFWSKLKRGLKRVARVAMPLARRLAPFVPGGSAALTVATPFLKQAGIAGYNGIGALYQAADGSLYQMQGIDADELLGVEDDELRGLSEQELQGLEADDELSDGDAQGFEDGSDVEGFEDEGDVQGFDDDSDVEGFGDDDELRGATEEIDGFADDQISGLDDDEVQGIDGYVRQNGVSGMDGFVPDVPRATPWFGAPSKSPPLWSPLW